MFQRLSEDGAGLLLGQGVPEVDGKVGLELVENRLRLLLVLFIAAAVSEVLCHMQL